MGPLRIMVSLSRILRLSLNVGDRERGGGWSVTMVGDLEIDGEVVKGSMVGRILPGAHQSLNIWLFYYYVPRHVCHG